MLSLAGDAALYVHSLPSFTSLSHEELLDKLAGRFGAAQTLSDNKRRLQSRKKLPEESYAHLAADIMRLAGRVYHGAPHLAEQEARDAFLKALPDVL